jgi:hypothetical protein
VARRPSRESDEFDEFDEAKDAVRGVVAGRNRMHRFDGGSKRGGNRHPASGYS